MTHHMIILDTATDYRTENYGVLYQGRHVYRTTRSSAPTRLVVWLNTTRPNPYKDARLGDVIGQQTVTEWFLHTGKTGPAYLDPQNEPTDDSVSLLLSPESTCITSSGGNTGTPASGQVYAPGKLADGDTATLSYPDGTTEEIALHFPKGNNGHGYATFT